MRPYRLVLEPLSPAEKSLVCEFLSKPAIDAELRGRLEAQIARQPKKYWRLRLPTKKEEESGRKSWIQIIQGPFGGWERRGTRIHRKHDPRESSYRLRLALVRQTKKPSRTFTFLTTLAKPVKLAVVLEEDYFHWLLLRAVATGELTKFVECWYCGRITWRHRRSALFCQDSCRMRYHAAIRNQGALEKLPSGIRRRRYREMRQAGREIGLLDMPRVREASRSRAR